MMEIANEDVRTLVEMAKQKGLETAHTRYSPKTKCSYGRDGICCNLCTNGPCRITEKTPYGVCGMNAHQMVAKNLLRRIAAGTACYVHVCENTAFMLKRSEVKDRKRLEEVAEKLGVEADARAIADFVIKDIYAPGWLMSSVVMSLAPKKRLEVYEKLDLIPRGAKSEVFDALVKTSTNLNTNVVDMLMHSLRLGLITGYVALKMHTYMTDIMLRSPKITEVETGVGAVDPEYVNIMVTGHQSPLQAKVVEAANDENLIKKAVDAGAKGIRIIGSTCVGQDLQGRIPGFLQCANNFGTEPLAASGLIDAIVSEFNCTFPGLTNISQKLGIRLMAIDDAALLDDAELLKMSPENARDVAREIVERAIETFKARERGNRVGSTKKAIVGFTEDFVAENMDKILEILAEGKVKGVVAVVGCSNLVSGHDVLIKRLTEELLKRDILVWTAGCTSYALQGLGYMSEEALDIAGEGLKDVCGELALPPVWDFGMCMGIARISNTAEMLAEKLGIDIPDLPVAVSAPQWLEEQALGDAAFALASGYLLHAYPSPYIDGSDIVTEILTKGLADLTGGRLLIEGDAEKAAEAMERHIIERRKELGLKSS